MQRATVSIAVSIAAHGLLLGMAGVHALAAREAVLQQAQPVLPQCEQGMRGVQMRQQARVERASLVQQARHQRDLGKLELGAFLIQANRIDAMEAGIDFAHAEASQRYDERLRALRGLLSDRDLNDAVPIVFGDLRYYGRPGGLMGEALMNQGGSCEQLSLLVAASAYDAGRRDVRLRIYGGRGPQGVGHVAAVRLQARADHDLISGKVAHPKGATVEPEQLIDIYARAHRVDADATASLGHGSGSDPSGDVDASRPTLAAGFPANADIYPGSLPIYAERGVMPPDSTEGESAGDESTYGDPVQHARRCGYYVRMAVLDPATVRAPSSRGWVSIEPRRIPHPSRLDTEAQMMRDVEQVANDGSAHTGDRLMAWACMVALGELSAVDFALAGEHQLARDAMLRSRQAHTKGSEIALRWSAMSELEREGVRSDLGEHAGRTWLLLLVDGGEPILMDLIDRAGKRGWGKISSLAGLVVWPATRQRALAMIERYPLDDQVDVMHELYHTHDHMAPWASDYDLDNVVASETLVFLRAWKVFRGLAWRIWNGRKPVQEMLDALHDDCDRSGLDRSWEAALLEYTTRNMLGLIAMRSQSLDPVRQLRRAAMRNGHPAVQNLIARLSYIETQGELTATTLADAWHVK